MKESDIQRRCEAMLSYGTDPKIVEEFGKQMRDNVNYEQDLIDPEEFEGLSTYKSSFRPYGPGTVYYDPWLDDITYKERD